MHKLKSLRQKVFTLILIVSILLLLALNGVNFVIDYFDILKSYKRETTYYLQYAVSLIDADYLDNAYSKVKDIYENTPEEIRADPFSEEYRECLYDLVDDDFWAARDILVKCRENTGLDSVCFIMPDEENERIVFVVDGYDISGAFLPGQWLSEEITQIDTPDKIREIIGSDYKMFFDHGEENGWIATNYIEIFDQNGNFIGYAAGDINIDSFVRRMRLSLAIYFVHLIILVIVMALIISKSLQKRIIDPINVLAGTAKDYTKRDKALEEEGRTKEYFGELSLHTGDEIETLWESLSDMEKDMNDTMHRIRVMTADKERVEAELSVATKIQEGMLPKKFPAFPGREEFEVYASMDPAKEVGGDFYDFFLIDDDHLCLSVGDVSGKGVPAALFMVVAITALRNIARREKDIVTIMKDANNQICKYNQEGFFVTVWLGIYTISEHKLSMGSAGHEYPAIYRAGEKKYSIYESEHDIPMGIMENVEFVHDETTLEKGDKLFVYTDGVPEATRADDMLYGMDRMLECLNGAADRNGKGTLEAITRSVDKFVGDAPQFDDLTMLYLGIN